VLCCGSDRFGSMFKRTWRYDIRPKLSRVSRVIVVQALPFKPWLRQVRPFTSDAHNDKLLKVTCYVIPPTQPHHTDTHNHTLTCSHRCDHTFAAAYAHTTWCELDSRRRRYSGCSSRYMRSRYDGHGSQPHTDSQTCILCKER